MNVIKRISVAFLAAVVLFTSIYATTIDSHAMGLVEGMTIGELIAWLVSSFTTPYYGMDINTLDNVIRSNVHSYDFVTVDEFVTGEGLSLTEQAASNLGYVVGGVSGSVNAARLFLDAKVDDFLSSYSMADLIQVAKPLATSYINHLEKSGALDLFDQDITYNGALPDWFRVGERVTTYDTVLAQNNYSFSDTFYQTREYNNGFFVDVALDGDVDSNRVCFYFHPESSSSDRFYVTCGAVRDGYSLVSSYKDNGLSFDFFDNVHIYHSKYYQINNNGSLRNYGPTSAVNGRFDTTSEYVYTGGNFFYEDLAGNVIYVDLDGICYDAAGNVLASSITTAEGCLTSAKAIVKSGIKDFSDKLSDALDDVIASNPSITKDQLDKILEQVNNYYKTVVENYYQDTTYVDGDTYVENITNIFNEVLNPSVDIPAIDDAGIIDAIKSIPASISAVLTDIFVPDPADIKPYVDDVLSHFKWIKEPWDFMQQLVSIIFTGVTEPPVIYIDFRLAESDIRYGGREVALDLSWYARYKPAVDTIIVGFCWIWFGYWFFRNLPEIISGSSPASMLRSKEKAESNIESDHNNTAGKI